MADGLALGFVNLADSLNDRVLSVGEETVLAAVQESLDYHNEQLAEMYSMFCDIGTTVQERYEIPADNGDMQPLDEFGEARAVLVGGNYTVAYPMRSAGSAWGYDRQSYYQMTVAAANRLVIDRMQRDAAWFGRHISGAFWDKTTYTYADTKWGTLTMQPLANGDTVEYLKTDGTIATAQHYVAQSAAIADATNPFSALYTLLRSYPQNQGKPILCFINSAQQTLTEALTGFEEPPDSNLRHGDGVTQLGQQVAIGPGNEYIGYMSKVHIATWNQVPAGYILGVVLGAPKPLYWRQHEVSELQGLRIESQAPGMGLFKSQVVRYGGCAVRNRLSAACTFTGAGDTTYDVPSGKETPLPA